MPRPIFWLALFAAAAASLFTFGMSLVRDESLLAQARRSLADARAQVDTLSSQLAALNATLVARTDALDASRAEVSRLRGLLEQSTKDAAALNGRVKELSRQAGEVATAFANKDRELASQRRQLTELKAELNVVSQELSAKNQQLSDVSRSLGALRDAPHPYGKGNAKLTIFKRCPCPNLRVWVDGQYSGEVALETKAGSPSCGAAGTVALEVLAGKHHVVARDRNGARWDLYTTVSEDSCRLLALTATERKDR